ncbi:MAG: hypothetical protein O7G30_10455 [Proteobacteria bacterium]|nr:hypothetical protein [Pseudomonadota bacterium]
MRTLKSGSLLGLVCTLLLVAPPALAEHHEAAADADDRKPWDQQEMTELTTELSQSVRAVRRAWRKDPAFRNPENPNRRASKRMDQILRDLDRSTGSLAATVNGGGGLEETQGTARRIGMLLNDADVEGRRLMTGVWMAERVQPAMELINRIAPYYGSGPLYDPETMQRLDRPPNPGRNAPQE